MLYSRCEVIPNHLADFGAVPGDGGDARLSPRSDIGLSTSGAQSVLSPTRSREERQESSYPNRD